MTRTTRTTTLTAALAVAAGAWVIAVGQMQGMDMGAATELGSFGFFIVAWVAMMAAMMLPGAVPAALRSARPVARFAVSYLAVWAAVGLIVYALYQPHSEVLAGAVVAAAAVYELTPWKGECRRRCQATVRSGFEFGAWCVGSSIGLMVAFVALGVMSIVWMSVIAAVVLAQKLLPPRTSIDVPLTLAMLAVGIAVAAGA